MLLTKNGILQTFDTIILNFTNHTVMILAIVCVSMCVAFETEIHLLDRRIKSVTIEIMFNSRH